MRPHVTQGRRQGTCGVLLHILAPIGTCWLESAHLCSSSALASSTSSACACHFCAIVVMALEVSCGDGSCLLPILIALGHAMCCHWHSSAIGACALPSLRCYMLGLRRPSPFLVCCPSRPSLDSNRHVNTWVAMPSGEMTADWLYFPSFAPTWCVLSDRMLTFG